MDAGPCARRSGDRIAIAAYLGSGAACDWAVVRFAKAYADLPGDRGADTRPGAAGALVGVAAALGTLAVVPSGAGRLVLAVVLGLAATVAGAVLVGRYRVRVREQADRCAREGAAAARAAAAADRRSPTCWVGFPAARSQ